MVQELQNKLIAVLGYGTEGKAVTRFLLSNGLQPVIFDEKPFEKFSKEDQEEIQSLKIPIIFGSTCLKELIGFDIAFRSPGIPTTNQDLQLAKEKGLKITSQTNWFFENCPARIIGVTGTKGKGTTCSLIANMLERAKLPRELEGSNLKPEQQIYLTGNIGKVSPLDILNEIKENDFVIFELSSFQLQDLTKSPHTAVVLMVTSEHLDYHKTEEDYRKAKESITKFQIDGNIAIINDDFPASKEIGALGHAQKFFFSRQHEVKTGSYIEGNKLNVVNVKNNNLVFNLANTKLKGQHNYENISAAVLCATSLGVGSSSIQEVINEFEGLEHRLQFVIKNSGVSFYNDSFATTPESTSLAVSSFSEPLIVIIGGSSKRSNFKSLAKNLSEFNNIKALIVIGEETNNILLALGDAGFNKPVLTGAKNMTDIFMQISNIAKFGDVVLLSPACASFDMFKNYVDRGEQFTELAKVWNKHNF